MKKSKVIVPAMALLLFSTAASITGTVAWFSATRVFTTEASTFAVNSIDGNLQAKVWGRVGTEAIYESTTNTWTKASKDDTTHISNGTKVRNIQGTNAASRLTHGSFNHKTTRAWTLDSESADGEFLKLQTEADAYAAEKAHATLSSNPRSNWFRKDVLDSSTTYSYFAAFSWEINFSYTFGAGETKVGIFLDTDESNMTIKQLDNTTGPASGKILTGYGFRIAMYPVTVAADDTDEANAKEDDPTTTDKDETVENPDARILGNYANGENLPLPLDNTKTYTPHYVTGTSTDTGSYTIPTPPSGDTPWGTGNYMIPTATNGVGIYDRQADAQASSAVDGDADKVCYIEKPSAAKTGTARLICVAWYEGTSPFVVTNDNTEMDSVTANLTFYGRAVGA